MQVSFIGDSLPEQGCFWTRTGAVFSDDGKGKDDLFMFTRISGGKGGKYGGSLRTSSLGPLHLAHGRINHAGEGMGMGMLAWESKC